MVPSTSCCNRPRSLHWQRRRRRQRQRQEKWRRPSISSCYRLFNVRSPSPAVSLFLIFFSVKILKELVVVASTAASTTITEQQRQDHEGDTGNSSGDATDRTTVMRNSGGCGIYLAPSSIPFSGLGMYVGNASFSENDIVATQDVVIPIVDRHKHTGHINEKWLFDEYIWNAGNVLFCVIVCNYMQNQTKRKLLSVKR